MAGVPLREGEVSVNAEFVYFTSLCSFSRSDDRAGRYWLLLAATGCYYSSRPSYHHHHTTRHTHRFPSPAVASLIGTPIERENEKTVKISNIGQFWTRFDQNTIQSSKAGDPKLEKF